MFLIEGMFNTVFTSCINRIFQLFFNHNILKMSHKSEFKCFSTNNHIVAASILSFVRL
jgi:hypothetical protein